MNSITKVHTIPMKIYMPTVPNYENAVFIYTFMMGRAVCSLWQDCLSHLCLYETLLFDHNTLLRYHFPLKCWLNFLSLYAPLASCILIDYSPECVTISCYMSLYSTWIMNYLEAGRMLFWFCSLLIIAYLWISELISRMYERINEWMSFSFVSRPHIHSLHIITRKDLNSPLQ